MSAGAGFGCRCVDVCGSGVFGTMTGQSGLPALHAGANGPGRVARAPDIPPTRRHPAL